MILEIALGLILGCLGLIALFFIIRGIALLIASMQSWALTSMFVVIIFAVVIGLAVLK